MATKKKTAKKSAATKTKKKAAPKNSLVANINRKKRQGTSRAKSKSTVSKDAYQGLKKNWGRKKKH